MTQPLTEDRTVADIYAVFRREAHTILHDFSAGDEDMLLLALDRAVETHFESLVILRPPVTAHPDNGEEPVVEPAAPQTSAQAMEDGIFNLVVSLVIYYSTQFHPDHARAMVGDYLTHLVDGLSPSASATSEPDKGTSDD